MINIKEFYCISGDTTEFTTTPDVFSTGPLPILWRYKGLYGMIPAAIVANAITILEEDEGNPIPHRCIFRWEQTMAVADKLGELLFNEQFNNQTEQSKS